MVYLYWTHFMFTNIFFWISAVYEITWEKKNFGSPASQRWQYGACALHAAHLGLQIHTQDMQYLLIFRRSNGCTNAHLRYIIYTLPVLIPSAAWQWREARKPNVSEHVVKRFSIYIFTRKSHYAELLGEFVFWSVQLRGTENTSLQHLTFMGIFSVNLLRIPVLVLQADCIARKIPT